MAPLPLPQLVVTETFRRGIFSSWWKKYPQRGDQAGLSVNWLVWQKTWEALHAGEKKLAAVVTRSITLPGTKILPAGAESGTLANPVVSWYNNNNRRGDQAGYPSVGLGEHIFSVRGPLRECHSIRSGASRLSYYCAPLVCVCVVIEHVAVCQHNKPKTKKDRVLCGGITNRVQIKNQKPSADWFVPGATVSGLLWLTTAHYSYTTTFIMPLAREG